MSRGVRLAVAALLVAAGSAPARGGDTRARQVSIQVRFVEVTGSGARDLGVDARLGEGSSQAADIWFALKPGALDRGDLPRGTEVVTEQQVVTPVETPASLAVGGQLSRSDVRALGAGAGPLDVGIELTVAPRVVGDGSLVLEVRPQVSELVFGPDGLAPATRSAATSVTLSGDQTLVIGGLLSEGMRGAESRVPALGDIPGLGRLFRDGRWRKGETHLVVLLQPAVLDPEGSGRGRPPRHPPVPSAAPPTFPAPVPDAHPPPPQHTPPPVTHPPQHPPHRP
jgi:type II secretory pathway component HofQ